MKRRTFTLGLGALFAAPALPASAVQAPAAHLTQHFARAKLLARCHGSASPAMLSRLMKLDGHTAKGVFDMLQNRGVVAHGLDGIARAVTPLNTHCVPSEAIRARDLAQQVSETRQKVRKIWDKLAEDTPQDTSETENGDQLAPAADEQIEAPKDLN